jgi:hypothetical protein
MSEHDDGARYTQADGLEITHMPDGWVIYHLETDRVHFLNATAALVFELCNGRHTVTEIAGILSAAYELSTPTIDDVQTCVSNLVAESLVKQCS